jgi:glycosyltransferase involved in cell wall biosynthesis
MTPRIMQVMAGQRHGGAEAFFERLVVALHNAGVNQHVVMRRDAERAERLRGAGVDSIGLRFGGIVDLRTRWTLSRELRRMNPDVVMTWMSRATALLPSRRRAGDRAQRIGRLGGYYDLKYYEHCDHLVGNTKDIVGYIRGEGWPADRVHYVPNFVDAAPAPAADRRAAGVPSDAALVLALGRFHPNKAFDVLLAALAKAPGVHLWLAGEGELRARFEAEVRRFGIGDRVRLLGWRSDVGALMAACDMVVCSSRHEPLGNVVIEAWAHRRPIVCAASAGPAQLVTHEHSGLLVPIDDSDALAAAINRLAGDRGLREKLASGGYEAYRAEFTEAAVVGRYLELFRKVVG